MSNWLMICVSIGSMVLAGLIGLVLIPFLRKLHFGQTILEEGPKWHESKKGTPIMGGFMFIISSIVAAAAGYIIYFNSTITDTTGIYRLAACMIFSLLFSGIGFIDDYIKAVKKRNLGLTSIQKMIMQFVLCSAFLAALYFLGDTSTEINLMFFSVDIGYFYYPLMILFMIYISNAVNLTDGVDGLCGSFTFVTNSASLG